MSTDSDFIEQYEYARARLKQKKRLYFHFVIFALSAVFLLGIVWIFDALLVEDYFKWFLLFWFVIVIYHFIKVYITDKFMNKRWEKLQIERLIKKQQQKIVHLENNLNQ